MLSKPTKIITSILTGFLIISLLHVWLNIGLEKVPLLSRFIKNQQEESVKKFAVGFLPVT
jgi:hypothetical protein